MTTTVPSPLARLRAFGAPPRLLGLDVARAVAVIGMVGAHVGAVRGPFTWSEPSTWTDVVNGRSSILFAVLAGVSVALVTGRSRRPAPSELPGMRLRLVGRGAAIFVVGVVLELLSTGIAVILTLYGLLYVAALPFLRWRRRWLWTAVAFLTLAGPPLLVVAAILTPGGWFEGDGATLVLGTYPLPVWLAFLLAGLAVGRTDLGRVRTGVALLVAGAAVSAAGYGAAAATSAYVDGLWGESESYDSWSSSAYTELDGGTEVVTVPGEDVDLSGMVCDVGAGGVDDGWASCYAEAGTSDDVASGYVEYDAYEEPSYAERVRGSQPWAQVQLAWLADEPHSGGTLEILGSGGLAVAVIGLCLLVARPLRWALVPLAALGSMPLTAYAAHVVAVLVVEGPDSESLPDDDGTWAWMVLGLAVGTTAWALLLGRGPLERLVGRAAAATAAGLPPAPASAPVPPTPPTMPSADATRARPPAGSGPS
ncbi:heparan-alpha-glucosaminide N-acetyltransferase domain-containing protein [Nocardioides zeae]|uniref:Heparan-alpha-glucosaminide N-acetyltransferase domain-containing protein n=1 Tax=Nocardioides imazamoxiresistens TaxID=3231893 RepID=A0ABU3PS25_9ACTN|nr:heparan-alpha-glucosaminide N-acetyltransferase domain-containing protein [Nocardioides zeae]MDT9592037.1 heparan-alpha-glucosaminide N-acetyltransferase domain-containing protein [Nocardioides zeae]